MLPFNSVPTGDPPRFNGDGPDYNKWITKQPKSHESDKGTYRDQSGVDRAGREKREGMEVRVIRTRCMCV